MQSHVDFMEKDEDKVMKYSMDPTIIQVIDTKLIKKMNLFYT